MAEKSESKPTSSQPSSPHSSSSSSSHLSSKPTTRAGLLAWRIARLKEILHLKSKSDDRGEVQRKVRWNRSGIKRDARVKRVGRDRVRRKLTKRIQQSRLHKGQNVARGGK